MIHSCHLLPDCSLRLAGLKGSPPLTPAADQAVFLEALAGKLSTVNVPFTQRFGRFPAETAFIIHLEIVCQSQLPPGV